MRLNLRYVIPMMCGTCIALTVSVAAAVSGTLDNEKEISLLPAASETENRVYHSNGFTAPTAYSGGSIADVGTDLAEPRKSPNPMKLPQSPHRLRKAPISPLSLRRALKAHRTLKARKSPLKQTNRPKSPCINRTDSRQKRFPKRTSIQ